MLTQRATAGTTKTRTVACGEPHREPIVAVVRQETAGRSLPSWVFVAESGTQTRLVLGPRRSPEREPQHLGASAG